MATAQTVQQWHDKMVRWVPSWWFENKYGLSVSEADAVFYGLAAVFNRIEQDMLDQQAATFIMDSSAPILDLLGDERSCPRISGQADDVYDSIVQNCLFLSVNETQLDNVINACLNNGTCLMFENQVTGFYSDPDVSETPGFLYYSDQYSIWLSLYKWYNWWTVLIPIQTGGSDMTIAAAIISAIQSNKAAGTTYDVVFETTQYVLNEDGSYALNEDGSKIILEQ